MAVNEPNRLVRWLAWIMRGGILVEPWQGLNTRCNIRAAPVRDTDLRPARRCG